MCFFKNTCRVHEKEDIIDQYEDESELFRDRNEKLKLEVLLIMTTCNNNKYTVHVGLEVCYFWKIHLLSWKSCLGYVQYWSENGQGWSENGQGRSENGQGRLKFEIRVKLKTGSQLRCGLHCAVSPLRQSLCIVQTQCYADQPYIMQATSSIPMSVVLHRPLLL